MSNLKRLGSLLLLLSVTACIGSSGPLVHLYGGEGQRQNGSTELDDAFNHDLIGKTYDQLIVQYGPASRTATLDSGYKMMQYNSKRTIIYDDGKRNYTNCELRLWLRDKKVRRVDYLGDQVVCAKFIITGRKNFIDDDRLHFTNAYRQ